MRNIFYLLLSMCLFLGCKTAKKQESNLPVSGLFPGKQARNDSLGNNTVTEQKKASLPKKCKGCYIVNVVADNGATATVPVNQGDTETKVKQGTMVSPQTQNVAPGGTIEASQELVATTENKKPFPWWWWFLLPLVLLLVYLARRYL